LIFKHLSQNEVTLEHFRHEEMRMLVLAEGLQSQNDTVRDDCIEFLSKSVLARQDDLSYLLSLVNCKLAFTNQYYNAVPYLIVLAIIKVLPNETALPIYLRDVVYTKLRTRVADVTF
jgi:hypothetical protein